MEQSGPGSNVLGKIASPFVNYLKRVAMDFGVLTEKFGPEDEIVRYEGTLRMPTASDHDSRVGVDADGREAVTF